MADPIYVIPEAPGYRLDIRKLQNSDPANAETVFNPMMQAVLENIQHLKTAQGTLDYIPNDEKGVPGGVAILGPDGKIPTDQLQATAETLNFGKTDGENGLWDRQTAVPTGTQAIRYNGYLRAARVYGMYYSDSADYAEAYAVAGACQPGDLIAMGEGGLCVNTRPENPAVLGFVSDTFATLIGFDGDHQTPIALMGRVRVKVCGPVRAGDLLTASVAPGAVQTALGNPPRGAIVGQALETDLSTGPRRVWALAVRM